MGAVSLSSPADLLTVIPRLQSRICSRASLRRSSTSFRTIKNCGPTPRYSLPSTRGVAGIRVTCKRSTILARTPAFRRLWCRLRRRRARLPHLQRPHLVSQVCRKELAVVCAPHSVAATICQIRSGNCLINCLTPTFPSTLQRLATGRICSASADRPVSTAWSDRVTRDPE
jgi:hypothetical protein